MRVLFSFFWCNIIGKQPKEDLTSIVNIFSNIVQIGKKWQKISTQLKKWSNEANLFFPKKNMIRKKKESTTIYFYFLGHQITKCPNQKIFFALGP
jgi:hypothetical protein